MKRCIIVSVLMAAVLLSTSVLSHASDAFPSKPITVYVTSNPGGVADTSLRAYVQPALEKFLGQPLVVVNRGGGEGVVATNEMLSKPADGYTICYGMSAPVFRLATESPAQAAKLNILATIARYRASFCVPTESPYKDFRDILEAAKTKQINYGSQNNIERMNTAYIIKKTGANIRPVPISSGNDSLTKLLGGHLDFSYFAGFEKPYVEAGKMRVILSYVPGVPGVLSASDIGFPECEVRNTVTITCHKDVPADVLKKWEAAFNAFFADTKTLQEMYDKWGWLPQNAAGAKANENIHSDTEKYKEQLVLFGVQQAKK